MYDFSFSILNLQTRATNFKFKYSMQETKYLVDNQWLSQQLNNPAVAIVDCRFQLANPHWGEREYRKSHIKGAYYLNLDRDLSSEVQRHGGRHPLPHIEIFSQKLAQLGIVKNKTFVVAYDNSRFAFAARLWWLLRYLGHNKVALLDGGWDGWIAGNYPVSTETPQAKSGSFLPQPHSDWLVNIETVKAAQTDDSIAIIDSRDSDRYAGIREPIDPIAGSIDGAVNSPWKQVTNDSGYFQPLAKQRQLWEKYRTASEIFVYCGSGVTACVNLFSLEIAGLQNTKLYPGGWSDWCSYLT